MSKHDVSTEIARSMVRLRAEQNTLFDVPLSTLGAWDIVLILYIADAEGRSLTGRAAIVESGIDFEAGRRWLSHLARSGIIVGDGKLDPDVVVTLAPFAVTRMEAYIEGAQGAGE